jgi:hypothetical protein
MLFDPSRLLLHHVKQLRRTHEDLFSVELDQSALLPLNPVDLATDASAQLQSIEEGIREDEDDPEFQSDLESDFEIQCIAETERRDLERRRRLLNQYKMRIRSR